MPCNDRPQVVAESTRVEGNGNISLFRCSTTCTVVNLSISCKPRPEINHAP